MGLKGRTQATLDAGQLSPRPARMAGTVAETSSDLVPASIPYLRAGQAIGRYVVLSRLGAGAMGVVYAAYDPDLDRKVAIKLLRGKGSVDSRTRLLREAQALAQLSDPNVVSVHDAGVHEDRVFVAMEFVEGRTLREWLYASSRRYPEILAVVTAAGRGLAAAHRRGMVHRDFKPDNVMVGADGRVRVMDFGLARTSVPTGEGDVGLDQTHEADDDAVSDSGRTSGRLLDMALTRTGSLMGTPLYMAPEQLLRAESTARSDQFSFCVTLYEALHGVRPFSAESVSALVEAHARQDPIPPAPGHEAPKWLRRILLRGLAHDPARRYADMDALVAALESGENRRRRSYWLLGAASVGLLATVIPAVLEVRSANVEAACVAEGHAVGQVWNPHRERQVLDGIRRAGIPNGDELAAHVLPMLAGHAANLGETRTNACRQERIDNSFPPEAVEASIWCLEQEAHKLDTIVDVLGGGAPAEVEHAARMATHLKDVDWCANARLLAKAEAPPEPELRPTVHEISDLVTAARIVGASGDRPAALAILDDAVAKAESTDMQGQLARTQRTRAWILHQLDRHDEAIALGKEAYLRAVRSGAFEEAAKSAGDLSFMEGVMGGDFKAGLLWTDHQAALSARLPDPHLLLRADHLWDRSGVLSAAGRDEEALPFMRETVELFEQAYGPHSPELTVPLTNVAISELKLGKLVEATAHLKRAIAIGRATSGPDAPEIGNALNTLADVLGRQGKYEEAVEVARECSRVTALADGARSTRRAACLTVLGHAFDQMGRYDDAVSPWEEAHSIMVEVHGADHYFVGVSTANLGLLASRRGEHEKAVRLSKRALAIHVAALGPDHERVRASQQILADAYRGTGKLDEEERLRRDYLARMEKDGDAAGHASALTNLADVLIRKGEYAQARPLLEQAGAIRREHLSEHHPHHAWSTLRLGKVLVAQGLHREGLQLLEQALDLRERVEKDPHLRAEARYELARALWEIPEQAGRDRDRALRLAKSAVEEVHGEVGTAATLRATIEAWLAERP